eukprot:gene18537-22127_t
MCFEVWRWFDNVRVHAFLLLTTAFGADPRHLETAISIAGSTCGGALGSALVIGLPTPSDKITLSILSTADTSFWEPELVAQADVWLPEALSAVLEMALHDVE